MFKNLSLLLIPLIIMSCATEHTLMRGTVTMKLSESTAHICLGDNEVKKGDKVIFYYNNCEKSDPDEDGRRALCFLERIGQGEVTKTMGAHYSAVKTDGSFSFNEGTLVQRK